MIIRSIVMLLHEANGAMRVLSPQDFEFIYFLVVSPERLAIVGSGYEISRFFYFECFLSG